MNDSPVVSNPTVFLTGGTGSYGRAMTEFLLTHTDCKVRVFSRDEAKHEAMRRQFPPSARLTYIMGDVRDLGKLRQAMDGSWAVIHAAALKRVMFGEEDEYEFTRTNVDGSANVIAAALDSGVSRSLLISSDKAVNSINTYGKTKALAEDKFVQASKRGVTRGCIFAVVRGGNVWRSAGSVVPFWETQKAGGVPLTVTEADATRFHLDMKFWTAFGWWVLMNMRGGEIFCPKPAAWRLGDLAEAMAPSGWMTAGPRDGDKRNESLISDAEAVRTVDVGQAYVVEPHAALRAVWNYQPWAGQRQPRGWAFTSDTACRMKQDELINLLGQL